MTDHSHVRGISMTDLIQKQTNMKALHALNYKTIRDGLFNVMKWLDDGNHMYAYTPTDIVKDDTIIGKHLRLDIHSRHNQDVTVYIVTYIYGTHTDDPDIVIERLDPLGNRCPLDDDNTASNRSSRKSKIYSILSHVEETIKSDFLQS